MNGERGCVESGDLLYDDSLMTKFCEGDNEPRNFISRKREIFWANANYLLEKSPGINYFASYFYSPSLVTSIPKLQYKFSLSRWAAVPSVAHLPHNNCRGRRVILSSVLWRAIFLQNQREKSCFWTSYRTQNRKWKGCWCDSQEDACLWFENRVGNAAPFCRCVCCATAIF